MSKSNYEEIREGLEKHGDSEWIDDVVDKITRVRTRTNLTERQSQVYVLRKEGLKNFQIAPILGTTTGTICGYYCDAKNYLPESADPLGTSD